VAGTSQVGGAAYEIVLVNGNSPSRVLLCIVLRPNGESYLRELTHASLYCDTSATSVTAARGLGTSKTCEGS